LANLPVEQSDFRLLHLLRGGFFGSFQTVLSCPPTGHKMAHAPVAQDYVQQDIFGNQAKFELLSNSLSKGRYHTYYVFNYNKHIVGIFSRITFDFDHQ
jgi:hypothetical protein